MLYMNNGNKQTRWSSFENPKGRKGGGGKENLGAKGHAFDSLKGGESKILMEAEGSGIVRRIWLTISDRTILRELRIRFYWDNESKPAVDAPFGDFFCQSLNRMTKFENELFSSPEGKSFCCFVPMPFKTAAKIVVTNESDKDLTRLFYDVNYTLEDLPPDTLYFHGFWNRENLTRLGEDYTVLPKIDGKGRFIGIVFGVNTDPVYEQSWFGEGEIKMYLDGDGEFPTLIGTGTEDYIGTGWGQGVFQNMTQGSLVSDSENRQYVFYRLHTKDPVYFNEDCRVTMQQIGGGNFPVIEQMKNNNAKLRVVSSDSDDEGFKKLYELNEPHIYKTKSTVENTWYNYYRCDDFSSMAYFYFDKPSSALPELLDVRKRTEDSQFVK